MARSNNRIKRLQSTIARLGKIIQDLKDNLLDKEGLEEKINRGKVEHNASLILINDLGDNLPDGWSRKYKKEKNRFLYVHSKKNIHFWSAKVSEPESELDDLHPNDYD